MQLDQLEDEVECWHKVGEDVQRLVVEVQHTSVAHANVHGWVVAVAEANMRHAEEPVGHLL